VDTAATTGSSAGDLRVSDADRDRALTELGEHYQAGRLTIEELDERSGQALRAKTSKELEILFADLPHAPATNNGVVSAKADASLSRRGGVPVVLLVVLIVAAVSGISVATSGHGHQVDLGGLVPVLVLCYLFRRRLFSCWWRG
jgi:Domain of unknown function (DUF1707)